MSDLSRIPDYARLWAERCMRSVADVSDADVNSVGDWLAALAIERPHLVENPGRLVRMTWAQAMEAQRKWHDALAARTARLIAEKKGFGGAPDDVETVLELEYGFRWVRITSPEGLDYEGNAMGHCVGSGSYDQGCAILSLRDADNLPHCTVEWKQRKRVVEQVQGRANQQVVERYHGMVRSLVDFLQPSEVQGAGNFGHIFAAVNGQPARLTAWQELRKGDRIAEDLDLRSCASLTHLPDRLTVLRHIHLAYCTSLTHLPDRLVVKGDLDLPHCRSLTHLPNGLRVKGSLFLSGCTALTHMPDGLKVSGSLHLGHCTALPHLPDGLVVKGSLYLHYCTSLTHLPDGLVVSGNLDLRGCTSLTRLPDGLSVAGSLILNGCTALTHLPDGLKVDGYIDLERCTSMTHLPDGLVVRDFIVLPDGERMHSATAARAWFAERFPNAALERDPPRMA